MTTSGKPKSAPHGKSMLCFAIFFEPSVFEPSVISWCCLKNVDVAAGQSKPQEISLSSFLRLLKFYEHISKRSRLLDIVILFECNSFGPNFIVKIRVYCKVHSMLLSHITTHKSVSKSISLLTTKLTKYMRQKTLIPAVDILLLRSFMGEIASKRGYHFHDNEFTQRSSTLRHGRSIHAKEFDRIFLGPGHNLTIYRSRREEADRQKNYNQ